MHLRVDTVETDLPESDARVHMLPTADVCLIAYPDRKAPKLQATRQR